MIRRLALAAALTTSLTAAPAFAGTVSGGLQALKDYNLIVLQDWTTGHDVEGTSLVGGNMSGNSGSLGIGASTNPSQASVSTKPILTVGGNNNSNDMNINNVGVSSAPGVSIWGDSKSFSENISGADTFQIGGNFTGTIKANSGDTWKVGGNATNGVDQSGGSIQVGGTVSGAANYNGGTHATGVAGLQTSLKTDIGNTVSTVIDNVKTLSTTLSTMTVLNPSSFVVNGTTLTLNAVDGGSGYALATLNLDSFNLGNITSIVYNIPTNLPVFVNVIGGAGVTTTFKANGGAGFTADVNQQVVWNILDAQEVDFTTIFHGSVLAVNSIISNTTPIEGSVVAKTFNQGGEVHLGTYNGPITLTPSVPEPASWAMMIGGFALAGATMRRKARTLRFA